MIFGKYLNKQTVPAILNCFAIFLLYSVLAWLSGRVISDVTAASFAADGAVCVILGLIYLFEYRNKPKEEKAVKTRFSAFGWLVIFVVFGAAYVSSECIGNFLAVKYPLGITDYYANLQGQQLYLYILFAVTVAPVAEELLFRYAMFRQMRNKQVPFWLSVCVSALLFTVMHGTVMHIPVTVILSVFLCILYEVTGKFRLCIIFHILFNYAGATLLFAIPDKPYLMLIVYAAVFIVMILGYTYRDKVFGKYLKKGSLEQFESLLNDKIKHFGESENRADGMDFENAPDDNLDA